MLELEQVWFAACNRCANEGISFTEDKETADAELRRRGWTTGARQLCPDCSVETQPSIVPSPADGIYYR